MKTWKNTGRPSAVAGPVAVSDEHLWTRSGTASSSSAERNVRPVTALGVTGSAPSIESRSIAEFIVTISTRSTLRPWTSAPAAAAPSAIPFISSRNSGSNRRSMSASASVRRPAQPWAGSLVSRRMESFWM